MSDTIPPKALVAVERCSSYEQEGVYQALVKVIEAAGGIPLSSPEGKSRILLKPNHLSASGPEKAVTTHPAVMGAMTRYLVEAGHEVYAWDSPGFAGPDAAGAASGNRKAVESAGGTWVTGAGEYEEANPGGRLVRRFVLSDVLKKVDAVISMAKFKNHQLLYTTGALKNMFGLVPGLRKAQFHVRFPDKEHFARMIVDLNEAVPPVFTVMDGIIGMEGHGPGNGSPREIGLLLASQNPAALDIVFADIAGYDGLSLPVQAEAAERERWFDQDRPVREQIHIAGASMDELRIPDFDRIEKTGDVDMIGRFLPRPLNRLLKQLLIPRPVIRHERCIRCGECAGICSAGAMTMTGGSSRQWVHIDYSKCIRCYCCHEICPADAIGIEKHLRVSDRKQKKRAARSPFKS